MSFISGFLKNQLFIFFCHGQSIPDWTKSGESLMEFNLQQLKRAWKESIFLRSCFFIFSEPSVYPAVCLCFLPQPLWLNWNWCFHILLSCFPLPAILLFSNKPTTSCASSNNWSCTEAIKVLEVQEWTVPPSLAWSSWLRSSWAWGSVLWSTRQEVWSWWSSRLRPCLCSAASSLSSSSDMWNEWFCSNTNFNDIVLNKQWLLIISS